MSAEGEKSVRELPSEEEIRELYRRLRIEPDAPNVTRKRGGFNVFPGVSPSPSRRKTTLPDEPEYRYILTAGTNIPTRG